MLKAKYIRRSVFVCIAGGERERDCVHINERRRQRARKDKQREKESSNKESHYYKTSKIHKVLVIG